MIENIQNLYEQLKDQKSFIKLVAKDLGKRPSTLAQHWFRGFWSIPEEHEARVVELLQKTIAVEAEKVS